MKTEYAFYKIIKVDTKNKRFQRLFYTKNCEIGLKCNVGPQPDWLSNIEEVILNNDYIILGLKEKTRINFYPYMPSEFSSYFKEYLHNYILEIIPKKEANLKLKLISKINFIQDYLPIKLSRFVDNILKPKIEKIITKQR